MDRFNTKITYLRDLDKHKINELKEKIKELEEEPFSLEKKSLNPPTKNTKLIQTTDVCIMFT